MNNPTVPPLLPPPLLDSKVCPQCRSRRLWLRSAFRWSCRDCGHTFRRTLGWTLGLLFGGAKLLCLLIGFLPAIVALSTKTDLEIWFWVLNAACSLVAGMGLCARMASPWFTFLVGPAFSIGFFLLNLLAVVIPACAHIGQ